MRLGIWEIGLILVIILIIFGVGKLPQVGGAIGKSIRNFKKAQAGDGEELDIKSRTEENTQAK
jgi:sec-independent protein translocase protein TatA